MAPPPSSSSNSADTIHERRERDAGTPGTLGTPGRARAVEEYFESEGLGYEPIVTRTFTHEMQRPELARLASAFSSADYRTATDNGDGLERKDTLAGVELGDPVLDPSKPEFDFYKWARMFLRLMEEDGIKHGRAGFTFKNLNVSGTGAEVQLQSTVASLFMVPFRFRDTFNLGHKPEKQILRDLNGTVKDGEMLIVLGKPGSGCTTFLKSISGETRGLNVHKDSVIHYNGIPQHIYKKELRGDVAYNSETDEHFPHLTVGQTLNFAAAARTPSTRVRGVPRNIFSKHIADVMMTIFGLIHTRNTKVGNDYVRGVSGGERKRVSIAEMAVSGSPISCWDNSTRGLDAATALEFIQALRIASNVGGMTQAVAIYQASQAIYDTFDKAIVLYEGRQIYFGSANSAKDYFTFMGYYCPPRQTAGDFLTSITNPSERQAREGFECKVPRTPEEFELYWHQSPEFKAMQAEIEQNERENPMGGPALETFREAKYQAQAKHVLPKSPYTISIPMQVRLCTVRAYQRLWNDKASTISTIIGQISMALIIGSIFFGTPQSTAAFFARGSVLFFAILLNALLSITEINGLYAQRPIVERHVSFAFYHAFSEALAGIVSDIPVKFVIGTCFNIILYFLAGLRREPAQFFIFFLFVFCSQLCMSAIFRTLAAITKTISQALALAGVMVLAIVIYTGFTIQRAYMHPWFKWISWINPIAYGFEALLVNEVHGQYYACATLVPPYGTGDDFQCAVAGAQPGATTVLGDDWVQASYGYSYSHIWRNLGFIFAFMIFFYIVYLAATEFISGSASKAEFLVFRRGHIPKYMQQIADEEHNSDASATLAAVATKEVAELEQAVDAIAPQKDIFTWRNVVYDITVMGEPRRLLDHISGWVKPGTLTALMGVSGAGKTTLLDVLAKRTTMGVITGDMLVNGKPVDASFQRKTGYVQQQDLHLETTTVREALRFSAMLRQPKSVSRQEKYDYAEEVIKMLHMENFSEAIVGSPGEGLNVEQRKLLTIGVELAAKPALLLFLDEPTSGLDSQSSWGIVSFLRQLANNGQAILSTIHQPSAILFQEFDRLLFLAKGGKTVYFGDIGESSRTLLDYFESKGGRKCGLEENPAEYMLEIVGAGAAGKSTQDWPTVWAESQESINIQIEIDRIHAQKSKEPQSEDAFSSSEFAMPLASQIYHTTVRVFQQYWRTPNYVWGKIMLCTMSALFIGFSFYMQSSTTAGLQNTLFAIFMTTTIFSTLVQQIMPRFVTQRSLYEVRERPSKAYSWQAFLLANIIVEIPFQILCAIIVFASVYYPVFGTHQSSERQGLFLLYQMQFYIYISTFAHLVIAGLPDAETAGNIATTLFSLTLTFNGVLQTPSALPGFWIFMWRVSPLTYLVGGLAAVGLHQRQVHCANNELAIFDPPSGQTCAEYLRPYLTAGAPGSLYNPSAVTNCQYCPISNGDQFLAASEIFWSQRWRNFGIGWAYIVFNIFGTVMLYYLIRVRKPTGGTKRTVSIMLHYLGKAGYWVRSLFTRHREGIPKGTEHLNYKVY
ncbi:ABC-2 type transporter-domain-containing protein [Lipomyces doorenjongii]|uniref:ABC-2 type transporter-domain-containing protein n=1 Tax=Lipomyces doorenjongii TaxID=383834 RepID=UPI0034CF7CBF